MRSHSRCIRCGALIDTPTGRGPHDPFTVDIERRLSGLVNLCARCAPNTPARPHRGPAGRPDDFRSRAVRLPYRDND